MKKIFWHSIWFFSLIAFVILTWGFYKAIILSSGGEMTKIKDTKVNKLEKKEVVKNENNLLISILGDSVAKGTGDEETKGIEGNIKEKLKKLNKRDVVIENSAVDGFVEEDLLKQIEVDTMKKQIKKSDILCISIGGNDIRKSMSRDGGVDELQFNEKFEVHNKNFKSILDKIREINKEVYIVYIGLYNPYNEKNIEYRPYLEKWNISSLEILSKYNNSICIPTYDIFAFDSSKFISLDNLHPNADGYIQISNRIINVISSFYPN